MAITKSKSLSAYVAEFIDAGLDVGVFRSTNGNRFVLRLVDPDEPNLGLSYLAHFANDVREADRTFIGNDVNKPTPESVEREQALNEMLHDVKKAAHYNACFCTIDEESLAKFPDRYTTDDLGTTFVSIAAPKTVYSDAYLAAKDVKEEASVTGIKRNTGRGKKN